MKIWVLTHLSDGELAEKPRAYKNLEEAKKELENIYNDILDYIGGEEEVEECYINEDEAYIESDDVIEHLMIDYVEVEE